MFIENQLTKEDYLLANRYYMRKQTIAGKINILIISVVGLLLIIFGLYEGVENRMCFIEAPIKERLILSGVITLPIIVGLFYLYQAYLYPKAISKRYVKHKLNQSLFLKRTINVNDKGLEILTGEGISSVFPWTGVKKYYETLDFYFFEIAHRQLIIIVKDQLTVDNLMCMDQFIVTHVTVK